MGQEFKINDCGEIIREEQNTTKKANWWAIVSFLFFFALCILSYALYESYERNDHLSWQRSDLYNELQTKEATINSLQNQLPQTYYTKYSNQAIYYWDGSFIKAGSYYADSDVRVTIYLQKEGYGMTEFGWIPMNCLRK